jgi:capsular polysaccharide transport system permease protein
MLEKEIEKESAKITSNVSDKSLASKAVTFSSLMLDKEFAERQLTAALASLEQIKAESLKKQLYLERIAQPSEPDKAQEPRRIQSIIAIFLLSLVIWGIISIIIGGVREHHDK